MKAIVYERYGPPEVLHLKEVEKPVVGRKDIGIKVRAATITLGDCEMRSPRIPTLVWFIVRLFFGLFRPRIKVLGGYVAGEIEAVGEEVKDLKVGEKVFGVCGAKFGGYAEFVRLSSSFAIIPMPNNMTFEEAAPVALGLDSLHFLKKGKIQAGEKVLINGAGGGIGSYAVQLAKYFGAEVTAVDSGEKLEMLSAIGADHVIDYTKEDIAQAGVTYDLIFDVVGVIPHGKSLRMLRPKGRYLTAIPQLGRAILGMFNSLMSSKKIQTGLTSPTKEDLQYLKELIEAGHVQTVLDQRFALEDVPKAHRYVEGGTKVGNVILSIPS